MDGESLREILSRSAPDALRGFMHHWHGMVGGGDPLPSVHRLPAALRRFYGSYGTASAAFLINDLLAPTQIEDDNGFVVFYVEEQAVYLWAVAREDLDLDDPPVWGRENEPGKAWVQDAHSVSIFLVQMVVMSAALNAPHGAVAAWLAPEETDRALRSLTQLDLLPWHWPGHPARWYAGDETVAFSCPNLAPDDNGPPWLSVWIGARSDEAVRFLEPHLTDAGDYYSPRDG